MLALLAFLCLLWTAYWVIAYLRDEDRYSPGYVSVDQCTDCLGAGAVKLGKLVQAKNSHAGHGSNAHAGNAAGKANASSAGNNAHVGSGSAASGSGHASNAGNAGNAAGNANASGAGNNAHAGRGSAASGDYAGSTSGVVAGSRSGLSPIYTRPTGKADDLKKIHGVGDIMEDTLNDLGITTYQQLADFQDADVQKVSDALSVQNAGFGDRITRDEWVAQAKELAASGTNASYGSSNSNQSQSGGTSNSNQSQSGSSSHSNHSQSGHSSSSSNHAQSGHSSNLSQSAPAESGAARTKSGLSQRFNRPTEAADDLTKIRGIGDVMQDTLNDLGITTYQQLGGFQEADVNTVKDALSELHAGFGDRITGDKWVAQAKILAAKNRR